VEADRPPKEVRVAISGPFRVTWRIEVVGFDATGRPVGRSFLWRGPRFVEDAKAWVLTQPEVRQWRSVRSVDPEVVCAG
jgi:hypothetical protein